MGIAETNVTDNGYVCSGVFDFRDAYAESTEACNAILAEQKR